MYSTVEPLCNFCGQREYCTLSVTYPVHSYNPTPTSPLFIFLPMRMRSSLVVRASDCQCTMQLQRSWVRSQHPSAQWNLRGGRWSSAEYCTNKKRKKNPPKKYLKKKWYRVENENLGSSRMCMRSGRMWMRSGRLWMRSGRLRMRSGRLWMRSSRLWMKSSRLWMRSSWLWMRSS